MKLTKTLDQHLKQMMSWFPDRHSCSIWAGPDFRYPYTDATFRQDMRLHLPSYSMLDEKDELLGFGQYYLREGRCHLARLAIAPSHRGKALGEFLICELTAIGCRELSVDECSLFVLEFNLPAVTLYRRLGFRPAPYPGEMPADCAYLTAGMNVISSTGKRTA